MNIYFDCEFTGLFKNTELISLGMIADDGKSIYVEFSGIDVENQDAWIKDNVLDNTYLYGPNTNIYNIIDEDNYYAGTKEEIKDILLNWLSQFDQVQLVSDVCHYDMVLFVDIFGTAFDLPKNVSACCYDINQDIANYLNISLTEAFDINREDFLLNNFSDVIQGKKHNSFFDANVIKHIYTNLR